MLISVDLIKGSYYLNAEKLIALINIKKENNDKSQLVAWVCGQIHCLINFDNDKIKILQLHKQNLPFLGLTSLSPTYDENGFCIFASEPKILLSDTFLDQDIQVLYEENIPFNAYPSYRGLTCKFVYKLTISMQYLNLPVNFVKIPFKVLILQGLSPELLQVGDKEVITNGIINPFLTEKVENVFDMGKVLNLIQEIVTCRDYRHYNIFSEKAKICKLSISKSYYQLGDNIIIYLDFNGCVSINCIEVYACLMDEEEVVFGVNELFNIGPNKAFTQKFINGGTFDSDKLVIFGSKYCEKRAITLNTKVTNITLNVPFTVTPTFSTTIVKHRWKIHLEFTFSRSPAIVSLGNDKQNGVDSAVDTFSQTVDNKLSLQKVSTNATFDEKSPDDWIISRYENVKNGENSKTSEVMRHEPYLVFESQSRFPAFNKVETMVWDIPIKIFPTNPINISAQYNVGKISTQM